MARAIWNDTVVAESDEVMEVDGYPYFPETGLRKELFRPSATTTVCSWKGTASYMDIVVGDHVNPNAAWTYREPKPEAEHVRGWVGFWKGVRVEK